MFNTSFFNVKSIVVIAFLAILGLWIFKKFSSKGE